MIKFIKKLNWTGFSIVFLITLMGSLLRKQDDTIYESLLVFLLIGVPLSLLFLFLGIDEKNEKWKYLIIDLK